MSTTYTHDFSGWGIIRSTKKKIDPFNYDLWNSLFLGKDFNFYGSKKNMFCIGNGATRITFNVIEDSDDYSSQEDGKISAPSFFGCLEQIETPKCFLGPAIARVNIREMQSSTARNTNFTGFAFVDSARHEWLRTGDLRGTFLEQQFIFNYTPPKK